MKRYRPVERLERLQSGADEKGLCSIVHLEDEKNACWVAGGGQEEGTIQNDGDSKNHGFNPDYEKCDNFSHRGSAFGSPNSLSPAYRDLGSTRQGIEPIRRVFSPVEGILQGGDLVQRSMDDEPWPRREYGIHRRRDHLDQRAAGMSSVERRLAVMSEPPVGTTKELHRGLFRARHALWLDLRPSIPSSWLRAGRRSVKRDVTS